MTENGSTEYSRRSGATRHQKYAQGKYPTQAQNAALRASWSPTGRANLTVEQMLQLSTHPYLTASQREAWATKAAGREDLVDYDAEAEEYKEDRLDRIFHARGEW